ncbi:MAG: hypothetical protein ACXVHJ_34710 [Solirubrobacteraceae bacterium]
MISRLPPSAGHDYPLTFSVDYPDRELDRLSSALRILWVIPIAILAATIEGANFSTGGGDPGVCPELSIARAFGAASRFPAEGVRVRRHGPKQLNGPAHVDCTGGPLARR